MRVYQFAFGHTPLELVVDISAHSRPEAIHEMRLIAEEMRACDDPYDLATARDYVRIWVTINPKTITEDDIADEWEDA